MQLANRLPRYRWMMLTIVWMSWMTLYMVRLGVGPLAPFLKEALNISNTQIGSLVSATGITYLPTLRVT